MIDHIPCTDEVYHQNVYQCAFSGCQSGKMLDYIPNIDEVSPQYGS